MSDDRLRDECSLRRALELCVETFEIQGMKDFTAYQIAKKVLAAPASAEPAVEALVSQMPHDGHNPDKCWRCKIEAALAAKGAK